MKKEISITKDMIVALVSFAGLIGLILSTIMSPFASMTIFDLDPIYDFGQAGGYAIFATMFFGLMISCVVGVIILIAMILLRKKENVHKTLLKAYFVITFIVQGYFISSYIVYLVRAQQFNFIKTMNSILFLFMSLWYIYIPAITMLLIYIIIKSVNNIRNNK